MKKVTGIHVLISFIIFLGFMIFVLPNESNKSTALGLTESPDTSLFYTSEELYQLAERYQEDGRQFYIEQRFTFDLVWPIAYGLFLMFTLAYLEKTSPSKWLKKAYSLPLVAVIIDYMENIMTATVMYRYPNPTFLISDLAGFATLFKWITLSVSFGLLMVISMLWILQKRKGGNQHE